MEPDLKKLSEDKNASWILIKFAGPGSAVIEGVGHCNIHPYQLTVAATELEVTGKNAIIEMRNKIIQAQAINKITLPH